MQQRKRYGTLTAAQAHAWDQNKARTGIGKLGALAYMEDPTMTAPKSQGRLKRAHKEGGNTSIPSNITIAIGQWQPSTQCSPRLGSLC